MGLWASPQADAQQPQLTAYAVALRGALDAAGLGGARIVCADSAADWSCLGAVDVEGGAFNRQLAEVVGVVGNAGRPPAQIGAGVPATVPVWVTNAFSAYQRGPQITSAYGAIAVANEWLETVVNATMLGSARLPSGFIYGFGVSTTPYGHGPSWHFGLLQATSPATGNYYASVATWAVAAVTQFVPSDGSWRLLPAGSGTGALALGGYYASFWSPSTDDFAIVAQKFYDMAGWGPRTVTSESATFTLEGQLLGKASQVAVYRSCFSTYKDDSQWVLLQMVGVVPVAGGGASFTVDLQAGCLYSITSAGAETTRPWLGCEDSDCESTPPPPGPAGDQALSFADADSCPTPLGPGRLMIDVSGSFECVVDDALGPCLRQAAQGRPAGPLADTRPHSLTGDLETQDAMVSVDMAVASGQQGLLGARVRPAFGALAGAEAMNVASGLWLVLAPRPGALAWSIVRALDDASFGAPVRSGALATAGDLSGDWFTARLQLRGARAVGSVVIRGSASLLFNIDLAGADFVNGEGFVGIGSGAFVAGAASFRNLVVSGTTTTCAAVPTQGSPVTVETCDDGSAGQVFELLLPPGGLVPANFSASVLPKTDAWDEDCGPKLTSVDLPSRIAECASNFSASLGAPGICGCSGFNGNGFPKARFDDLAPYNEVDLYVLQLPPLQLALSANTSLCVAIGGSDGMTLFLDACAPAGAVPEEQLWWFERSIADGVMMQGPLHVVKNSWVIDIWSFGEDVGSTVKADGYNKGSNQILTHPWPAMKGIIRDTQLGVCLGACRALL